MRFLRYKSGWYQDSYRHSLAARGIRTSMAIKPGYIPTPEDISVTYQEREGTSGKSKATFKQFTPSEARQPAPSAGKIAGEVSMITFAKQYATMDFDQKVERIRGGLYQEGVELLKDPRVINDPYRKQVIKDAMFQGAASRVDVGESYDAKVLKDAGVDPARLKNLDERARLAREGTLGAAGTREFWKEKAKSAAGGIKGFAGWAGGAAEATLATGLKNIRDASGQPKESVFDQLEREHAERKMKEVESIGVFNPLRAAGIDVEGLEAKERAKRRVYQEAIRADKEVESLYNNKSQLAKVDMSAFDQGNSYFKAGDREGLIKSITDLEAENGKIKDRWNIVQDTRRLVLSPENRDQSIHMESDHSALWSMSLSKGGASKLSDETKKISEVERSLRNSSNMLAARIGILRNKLKRMNAVIPPDATVPQRVNTIENVRTSDSGTMSINFIGNTLEANKGKFKGWFGDQK